MNDEIAKEQLTDLLDHYTIGSILHLLGALYEQAADEAKLANNNELENRCKVVEHALLVIGVGIDSVNPLNR